MRYSEHFRLKLPQPSDPVDVGALSENFERLDDIADSFKVGDILSTYRGDLGEGWLLCNGEAFDAAKYPALAAIAPDFLTSLSANQLVTKIPTENKLRQKPKQVNARYAAAFAAPYSTTTCTILWIDSIKATLSPVTITLKAAMSGALGGIIAAGEQVYFYIGKEVYRAQVGGTPVYVGDTPAALSTYGTIQDLLYIDGWYYAFLINSNKPRIIKSSSPQFTNPTELSLGYDASTSKRYTGFFTTGKDYVFWGWNSSQLQVFKSNGSPDVYTEATLTNTKLKLPKVIANVSTTKDDYTSNTVTSVGYLNGRYVLYGDVKTYTYESTTYPDYAGNPTYNYRIKNYRHFICSTPDLLKGPYTTIEFPTGYYNASRTMLYAGGLYLFLGASISKGEGNYAFIGSDPTDINSFQIVDLLPLMTGFGGSSASGDSNFPWMATSYSVLRGVSYDSGSMLTIPITPLPQIQFPPAKTYIRAK